MNDTESCYTIFCVFLVARFCQTFSFRDGNTPEDIFSKTASEISKVSHVKFGRYPTLWSFFWKSTVLDNLPICKTRIALTSIVPPFNEITGIHSGGVEYAIFSAPPIRKHESKQNW